MSDDGLNGRGWVEELVYDLVKQKNAAYACFMQNVNYFTETDPCAPLAAVGVLKSGDLMLCVNEPCVKLFEVDQRIELLKHEILHIIHGHVSSRGRALNEEYIQRYGNRTGPRLVNIAMDMVCNQYIDMKKMDATAVILAAKWNEVAKAAGQKCDFDPKLFEGVKVEEYGFAPNLTTEEYCRLLEQFFLKNKTMTPQCKQGLGGEYQPGMDGSEIFVVTKQNSDGSAEARNKDGRKLELSAEDMKKIKKQASEQASDATRDIAVDKIIKQVKDAVGEATFKEGRGFDSAEVREMIAQLNKPPEIPWHSVLRGLESRMRTTLRKPTWSRPSRRNSEHMGYKRRRKLYVWFVMDTSGSMGTNELSLVDAELRGIVSRGAVVEVIHQDASIGARHKYSRSTGLKEFVGRGGTNFSPALLESLRTPKRDKPAMMVVYTDGEGGIEEYTAELKKLSEDLPGGETTADGVQLLWILTEEGMSVKDFQANIAKFGRVIKIDTGKKKKEDKNESS